MCNGEFEIIKGRFKVPLLRGHVDKRITKHSTIEQLISSDIDHWMANLYIEVGIKFVLKVLMNFLKNHGVS